MQFRLKHGLVVLACLVPASAGAQQHQQGSPPQGALPPHLHAPNHVYMTYRQIRQGGAVIFMRHAKTLMHGKDATPVDFADCAKQRNLSPAGIEASKEIGEAFKILAIPVGKVLASPYCRTRDTARLAFGRVEDARELLVYDRATGWTMEKAGEALRRMAAAAPASGTNTVLVAHIFNATHAFGVHLEEGEAVVAIPDGKGGHRIAGRITATQWGDLSRDFLAFGENIFEMAAHTHGPGHGHPQHPTRPHHQ